MSKSNGRKSWMRALVFTALGLMIPGVALAQEGERRSTRHYDFDDDLVTAGLDQGSGSMVQVTRKPKISSLIVVRQNFLKEMVKSAEDI